VTSVSIGLYLRGGSVTSVYIGLYLRRGSVTSVNIGLYLRGGSVTSVYIGLYLRGGRRLWILGRHTVLGVSEFRQSHDGLRHTVTCQRCMEYWGLGSQLETYEHNRSIFLKTISQYILYFKILPYGYGTLILYMLNISLKIAHALTYLFQKVLLRFAYGNQTEDFKCNKNMIDQELMTSHETYLMTSHETYLMTSHETYLMTWGWT